MVILDLDPVRIIGQWLIDGLAVVLGWIISILPDSPISEFNAETPDNVVLGYITYFIPFPTMLLHFTAILSCIAIYYVYRVIARWLKLVRG